jgi:hypothetical protein
MGYSGARWTRIYEKNLKSKISCQTLFNTKFMLQENFTSVDILKLTRLVRLARFLQKMDRYEYNNLTIY